MAKPVIMTVDDDPEVLGAISRDLRRRYGADYRIVMAWSARDGLNTAVALKQRGTLVRCFSSTSACLK